MICMARAPLMHTVQRRMMTRRLKMGAWKVTRVGPSGSDRLRVRGGCRRVSLGLAEALLAVRVLDDVGGEADQRGGSDGPLFVAFGCASTASWDVISSTAVDFRPGAEASVWSSWANSKGTPNISATPSTSAAIRNAGDALIALQRRRAASMREAVLRASMVFAFTPRGPTAPAPSRRPRRPSTTISPPASATARPREAM